MPRKGIAYISLVLTAGTAIFAYGILHWHSED